MGGEEQRGCGPTWPLRGQQGHGSRSQSHRGDGPRAGRGRYADPVFERSQAGGSDGAVADSATVDHAGDGSSSESGGGGGEMLRSGNSSNRKKEVTLAGFAALAAIALA